MLRIHVEQLKECGELQRQHTCITENSWQQNKHSQSPPTHSHSTEHFLLQNHWKLYLGNEGKLLLGLVLLLYQYCDLPRLFYQIAGTSLHSILLVGHAGLSEFSWNSQKDRDAPELWF